MNWNWFHNCNQPMLRQTYVVLNRLLLVWYWVFFCCTLPVCFRVSTIVLYLSGALIHGNLSAFCVCKVYSLNWLCHICITKQHYKTAVMLSESNDLEFIRRCLNACTLRMDNTVSTLLLMKFCVDFTSIWLVWIRFWYQIISRNSWQLYVIVY